MTRRFNTCLIWGDYYEATGYTVPDQSEIIIEHSERAGGGYVIPSNLFHDIGSPDDRHKAGLTTWLVNQRLQGVIRPKVTADALAYAQSKRSLPVHERVDRLLRYIAKCSSEHIGTWVPLLDRTDSTYLGALAWSGSTGWTEVAYLCEELSKKDWIELTRYVDGSLASEVRLTVNGHSRVAELNSGATERNLRRSDGEGNIATISGVTTSPRIERTEKYDFFICHASEDKENCVRPLAKALIARGLNVWYDEFTLKVGDSLRREIERGLIDSSFGIVVLSTSFFEKEWPQIELDGLVTLKVQEQNAVLPIWHGLSKEDVTKFSPTLADIVALNTSSQGTDEIVAKLVEVLN